MGLIGSRALFLRQLLARSMVRSYSVPGGGHVGGFYGHSDAFGNFSVVEAREPGFRGSVSVV